MFKSKKESAPFSVEISRAALDSIYDDCDNFDVDETGGRLLGTYQKAGGNFRICVTGLLAAGPSAQRNATYFLQDGEYQEKLFRAIEEKHPDVEHIGNWHTHHVNGLQTLSGGDLQLYNKIVNHSQHNTDFFYALLVTRRNSGRGDRYNIKHFFFRRGSSEVYEVPHVAVHITNIPLLTPASHPIKPKHDQSEASVPNPERARDLQFFQEFYPDIKALLSRSTGSPYWKGSFPLIDESLTSVVAMEASDNGEFVYSIAASCQNPATADVSAAFKERRFASARQGVVHLERELNRAIFNGRGA